MFDFAFSTLIWPEYPLGKGETSLSNAALSIKRPFSSKYIPSSAKYFLHGSGFPGATASMISCVRRTSSSCVTPVRPETPQPAPATARVEMNAATNCFMSRSLTVLRRQNSPAVSSGGVTANSQLVFCPHFLAVLNFIRSNHDSQDSLPKDLGQPRRLRRARQAFAPLH